MKSIRIIFLIVVVLSNPVFSENTSNSNLSSIKGVVISGASDGAEITIQNISLDEASQDQAIAVEISGQKENAKINIDEVHIKNSNLVRYTVLVFITIVILCLLTLIWFKRSRISGVKVFISYRRNDNPELIERLYDNLEKKLGKKNIFMDTYSIPAGNDFKSHITNEIRKSNCVIAIVGESWAVSKGNNRMEHVDDFIRLEIETAIENEIKIIPVFISKNEFPESRVLPPSIRKIVSLNGVVLRGGSDFNNDMDKILFSLMQLKKIKT